MLMTKRLLPFCLLFVTVLAAPLSAQRRPITESDLFKFVWVADPQMSPDGSQVAFVRVAIDEKKDAYESSIWIAKADGSEPPRAITSGIRDTTPRWSPDGRRVAFVRSAEKEGRVQPPQIYVMAMTGGEPWPLTDLPRGAGSPEWAPDGRTIAFSSGTKPEEVAGAAKPAGDKPRETDVRVITEAVYRANGVGGTGFVDRDRPSHIWTVALPSTIGDKATAKPLTTGEFAESNFKWSPDGSKVFFVSDRRREAYYYPRDSDLYSVSKDGGEPARVVSIDGSIGAYAFASDGKRVAFVGSIAGNPERSYSQPDLWVAEIGGTPRNLTADYDFDINGGLGGDQRAPRGQLSSTPVWSRDGRSISLVVGEQGNANIKRVDLASGRVEPITKGNNDVMAYSSDAGAQKLAYVLSSATVVGDLHVVDAATSATRKLTTFNDALFGQVTMNEPEEIWYPSFDGRKIQGWILKPPSFDPARKYPLILQIHGGPHSAYGNTFTHEFQWMAAKGYVVLYTNPRGSSNYGQDFGNVIQYNYPGDDYKDLMAGVDEVLKKGYIDETRLGVTGGSGGGLLTNWTVTQTTRFKAAVSQRDIADWSNFWYTADFTLFVPTWFRKAPFEDPADFAKRSPITYAAKIQTPLMFILGDEDYRTPPGAGGEDLFRALKYLKRPTVMVRFPGENHELSRSGRPWHRIERLQHIVGWFDKYLMGKETRTYDAPASSGPSASGSGPAQAAAPQGGRGQRGPAQDPAEAARTSILRGEYGRYRANNDLLSYHLDIRVDPEKKFLGGKNTIRFKMLSDDTRIQMDLYSNLIVEKILLGTTPLKYQRELNAVFIDFPETLKKGREYAIDFYYSGTPRETGRFGGIAFRKDPAGRDWINTACEGEGSSIWWPSKDQWRDEPETMKISVAVPNALMDVSNGRFLGKTDLGDGFTRWDWQVHYPINSYNVSVNIGAYVQFSDKLGDLTLDFFVLPENLEKAKKQFAQAKPMIEVFEKYIGEYAFKKDGFKLIEVPYSGMEHQSAVTYGNRFANGYLERDWTGVGISPRFDFIIIHESGHEWFGNAISAADVSDMWIHEGWTTYMEIVYVEGMWGKEDALKYTNGYKSKVGNKQPIITQRGVHRSPSQDQYFKGALFLNTLRSVVDDDKKWWKLLQDYYKEFKYKNIMTEDVVQFFNQHTGKNLTPIFDQYLRRADLPTLELSFDATAKTVSYRWKADEKEFAMPIRVGEASKWQIIQPTTEWKTMPTALTQEQFAVATDLYYVNVAKQSAAGSSTK
jgi:dipeptidyl aminopeptidase/acylaminoacyl peptidase